MLKISGGLSARIANAFIRADSIIIYTYKNIIQNISHSELKTKNEKRTCKAV